VSFLDSANAIARQYRIRAAFELSIGQFPVYACKSRIDMAQVTIQLPTDPTDSTSTDAKRQLVAEILGRHGLSLSETFPSASKANLQGFHLVATPDVQTAQTVVSELQSNGITAFVKPQTSAPM
jgi:hypothetical protein